MEAHWEQFGPPPYVSLAASIGWKPKVAAADSAPTAPTAEEINLLIAEYGGG